MLFSAKRLGLFLLCLVLLLSFDTISPEYLAWRQLHTARVLISLPALSAIPLAKTKLATVSAQLVDYDPLAEVTAKSYAVIDFDTGTVLLEKNYRLPLPPASTLKMMTALVARAYLAPDEMLSLVASDSADESKPVFTPDDALPMNQWLQALLVPSSNTAARVLARYVSRHGTDYLSAVSQHAQLFGLTDSKFFNATGIDAYGQVMSARDEALLARRLISDDQMRSIVAMPSIELIATPSGQKYSFTTTNQLLTTDPSVQGVKTGTTTLAGEVLVSLFVKPPRRYLVVVMGSRDRFNDTIRLMTKAQQAFEYTDIQWQSASND